MASVSHSAVRAELPDFGGKALECFVWIDLFCAFFHAKSKASGEKFSILMKHLCCDYLDLVYGLGGGESDYSQTLGRLKKTTVGVMPCEQPVSFEEI